jgi:hypothetical protein
MDLPPSGQTPIHFFGQKPRARAEPAFGLDEVEKEHPGELKKG